MLCAEGQCTECDKKRAQSAMSNPESKTRCYYCGASEKTPYGMRPPSEKKKHHMNCPERNR